MSRYYGETYVTLKFLSSTYGQVHQLESLAGKHLLVRSHTCPAPHRGVREQQFH